MEKQENRKDRLPVMAILAAAIIIPWGNRIRFAQALMFTFLVLVAMESITELYVEEQPIWSLVALLVNLLVYVNFAVICHRLILVGDDGVPKYGIFIWSRRELRFFMMGIVLGILFLIAIFPVISFLNAMTPAEEEYPRLAFYILALPIAYLVSRVILLFPSTAIGQKNGFKWAFNLTAGNGLRMTIIVILLPVLMFGVDLVIYLIFGTSDLTRVAVIALGYIVTVFEIAAISLSYDYLVKQEA